MNDEQDGCVGDHNFKDGVCQNDNCGLDIRGAMEFTFDDASHTYQLNGKKLTGTTTILGVLAKPALIPWAAKMAVEKMGAEIARCFDTDGKFVDAEFRLVLEEAKSAHTKKKDDAAAHGTDAHAIVEAWVKYCIKDQGGKPHAVDTVIDEKGITYQIAAIQKVVEWSLANVDHFLFSERMMYDATLWYAGTADFAYVGKDGKRYLGDFKTSSGIYGIDYWLQVAAYRHLAELAGDAPYDAMTIVRLGKDGKFEVQITREFGVFWSSFVSCLQIYRSQAKVKYLVEKSK